MALCTPCNQILDLDILLKKPQSRDSPTPYLRHHSSLPEFLQCVSKRECPICVAVWTSRDAFQELGIVTDDLNVHWDDVHTPVLLKFMSVQGDVSPTAARWVISAEDSEDGDEPTIGMLHSWTTEDDPLSIRFLSRPIARSSATQATFDRLRTWLEECKSHHPRCKQDEDHKLPTRVLDVGSPTTSPRLFETRGATGSWAALSYCWGRSPVLTTTSGNVEEHKGSIPLDSLPRTIRDAVTVTRELGLPYLWVDSLCIIQDSDIDWAKEAATMHAVYSNAIVTFAAESSPCAHVGIFKATDRHRQAIKTIPGKMAATAAGVQGIISFSDMVPTGSDGDAGPLSDRAWVLQEDQMARRHTRFAPHQVYWRCRTKEATESNILGSTDFEWDVHNEFRGAVDPAQWYEIVNRFGSRQITYAKDRLPAIAAIARVYDGSKHYNGYPAGLWGSRLHWGLLWVTDTPGCVKTYTAPSWSWASVHRPDEAGGQSRWFYTPLVYDTTAAPTWQVLQTSVGNTPEDPYGRVAPGSFLKASAICSEICRCRIPPLCFDEFERSPRDECLCGFGVDAGCPMHWMGITRLTIDHLSGCSCDGDVRHTSLLLVYVASSLMFSETGIQEMFAWCLLLEPRGLEPDSFTRVGSVTLLYGNGDGWEKCRQQEVTIF